MTMKEVDILVPVIFGIFGFIVSYFLRRGIGIVLLCVFLFAIFKSLEALSFKTDWSSLDGAVQMSVQLGKTLFALVVNMLSVASVFSVLLFIFGGVAGLLMYRRRAE